MGNNTNRKLLRIRRADHKDSSPSPDQITEHAKQQATLSQIYEMVRNSGHIRVSDTEIVAKIFTGLKIYLDPQDLSVTPHLALDGIWEGNISNAWLSVVKPNDIVFDIGANFGYFGALAAQKTDKKKSKVILFEPNPDLIAYIKKTLDVNWLNEQSVIENLALSDKDGAVSLNILEGHIGSYSLQSINNLKSYMKDKMSIKVNKSVRVKATSLDKYCKIHGILEINLIKMDIEGHEEVAYRGMRKIIATSPKVTLFVEFTKDAYPDPEKFYGQMLSDFGYIYKIDEVGNILKATDTRYSTIIGQASDWVMLVFSKISNLK